MKTAEAADELRTLTALFIANPKRLVALEMGIKRLKEEADDDPLARVKRLFRALTREQREAVTIDYCQCCWAYDDQCKCIEGAKE